MIVNNYSSKPLVFYIPLLLSLTIFIIACSHQIKEQVKDSLYSREKIVDTFSFIIDETFNDDTFSFIKKWDYYWSIIKNPQTGKFSRNDGSDLKPEDTLHIFQTAHCFNSVQGNNIIKTCHAFEKNDTIILILNGSLPAYGSRFLIYVINDTFYFEPEVKYPIFFIGQRISYHTTKKKLVLNKYKYNFNDKVIGYIDIGFIETSFTPKGGTKTRYHYLKGFISTTLQKIKPYK